MLFMAITSVIFSMMAIVMTLLSVTFIVSKMGKLNKVIMIFATVYLWVIVFWLIYQTIHIDQWGGY